MYSKVTIKWVGDIFCNNITLSLVLISLSTFCIKKLRRRSNPINFNKSYVHYSFSSQCDFIYFCYLKNVSQTCMLPKGIMIMTTFIEIVCEKLINLEGCV